MSYRLKELCKKLGVSFSGNGELELTHVCGLDGLGAGGVAYLSNTSSVARASTPADVARLINEGLKGIDSDNLAIVVSKEVQSDSHNLIHTDDPQALHGQIALLLHPHPKSSREIHPSVVIGMNTEIGKNVTMDAGVVVYDDVKIGDNTVLRAGVVVMHGVTIGKDSYLYPNVVVRDGCKIGDRVILHPCAVIGADGHGYFQREGKNIKNPQVGIAIIEDDVDVGSCATVDRGRMSDTIVRQGAKLDNQVQIAHNADVGANALISAHCAIGGSAKIGHNLIMGGQAAIKDHVTVGNNVTVMARAAITCNTADGEVIGGFPGRPQKQWMKSQANINRLDELYEKVRKLEQMLKE